jgi:hypothetical protein
LWSLPWFPDFLAKLKSLARVLRNHGLNQTLVRNFRTLGFHALADVIAGVSLPTFAEWRWGTLAITMRELDEIIGSLRMVFQPHQLGAVKDAEMVKNVQAMAAGLASDFWHRCFRFVAWLMGWLNRIQRFGTGCLCHMAQLTAGEAVDCWRKGRIIPEAFQWTTSQLDWGLASSRDWSPEAWDNDVVFYTQISGATRIAFQSGSELISIFDRLPFLWARLDTDGMRDRILGIIMNLNVHQLDDTTKEIRNGALWADVLAMNGDGTGMTSALQTEVDSIKNIPCNDTTNEGPHSLLKRVQLHSRAASYEWAASTVRLEQSFDLYNDVAQLRGERFIQQTWDRWSSILKREGSRRPDSKVRKPRRWVTQQIYNFDPDLSLASAAAIDAGGDGGGPGSGGEGGDGDGGEGNDSDANAPSKEDDDQQDGGDDAGGGEGGGGGGGQPPIKAYLADNFPSLSKDAPEVKLMREYLKAVFKQYAFYSVPIIDCDGVVTDELICFQLLELVSHFVMYEKGVPASDVLLEVLIQPFDTWANRGETCDVFLVEDAVKIDVIKLVGADPSVRGKIMEWQMRSSDTSGCLELCSASVARPKVQLDSHQCPLLCLVDELLLRGFVGTSSKVLHKKDPRSKLYDNRDLPKKRAYLQCVLSQEDNG